MNRGQGYDIFANAFLDHPEVMLPDGSKLRGRHYLIESLEEDMDAGIKMHLSHVYASKNVTVLEATFENLADNSTHCPPATTQVHFKRDGKADRIRLYFAPRPVTEAGKELASEEVTQF